LTKIILQTEKVSTDKYGETTLELKMSELAKALSADQVEELMHELQKLESEK